MSLRIATMLFSVMLPVAAVAQSLSPPVLVEAQQPIFDRLLSLEASSKDGRDADQFVPLWASPDGRLYSAIFDDPKGHGPESPDVARRIVETFVPKILAASATA